jgi:hypothetical protein
MVSRQDIVSRRTVSRQRFGKHVPAAMDTHATMGVLLETVLSSPSVQMSYKKDNWSNNSVVGGAPPFREDLIPED